MEAGDVLGVARDNTIHHRGCRLQLPASPLRAH
jgi:hypothetical protein